jgi:hypothetical protein
MSFCRRSEYTPRLYLQGIVVLFPVGAMYFLSSKASGLALSSTHPSVQRISGCVSSWVKRPGGEVDCSPPSSAEAVNEWSSTSIPLSTLWHAKEHIFLYFVGRQQMFAVIRPGRNAGCLYAYYLRIRLLGHVCDARLDGFNCTLD